MNVLRGFRTAENYLKRRKYRVAGLNMRVIKPQLLYEDRVKKKIYLATDFFEEGQVIQIKDMKKSEKKAHIIHALDQLYRVMDWKHNVFEIAPHNAFYNAATDTVLIFDLQQYSN